jgi:hypothetical protein
MKLLTIIFSLFSVLALAQTDSLRQEIDCEMVFKLSTEMPKYPKDDKTLIADFNEIVKRVPCRASGAKFLAFVVTSKGEVRSPVFQPGNLKACSIMLEKEFDTLPLWTPGNQDGIPVCVEFSVPIKGY